MNDIAGFRQDNLESILPQVTGQDFPLIRMEENDPLRMTPVGKLPKLYMVRMGREVEETNIHIDLLLNTFDVQPAGFK